MNKETVIAFLLFALLGCSYSSRNIVYGDYPSPFCPQTTISYSLPSDANVCITVYDVLGNQVDVIVDEFQTKGLHEINWDPDGFPSGVYFYKLEAGEFTQTKKMVLVR